MKNNALFTCLLLLAGSTYSQDTFFDDFESYSGGRIGPQSERWTTWSGEENGLEDPFIIPEPVFR